MWKISQIYDGDYGCEELAEGARPLVSVRLVNEAGTQQDITVEDAWLTERGLDVGSVWPAERVILASQSPRRKELLHRIVASFEIVPAVGEERSDAVDPREYVRELSYHKAREVMNRMAVNHVETVYVLGSDTIVVCDGEIMGKPRDREDACQMIRRLQGRSHEVMTGVTILKREPAADGLIVQKGQTWTAVESYTCITGVDVAPMDDAEIRRYLATGEADDKAGAYGIQGAFGIHVTGIRGSYTNVVGLPVAAVYQSLRRMGLQDCAPEQ